MAGGPGSSDPERLTLHQYTVQQLILWAYDLKDFQLSGLDKIPPAEEIPIPWIQFDTFDITAKVPPGAAKRDVGLMLQHMLAERFGLKVHFEKKETQTYNLVIAKAGTKIKNALGLTVSSEVSDPNDDKPRKPFDPSAPLPRIEKDKNGFPIIPKDTVVTGAGIEGRRRQIFHKETMESLVTWLSGVQSIGRPVMDATGLKDEYDFSLYWTQEELHWVDGVRVPPPADPIGGPSIFQALEQQVGLKLEQSKRQLDTLVVDHIDRTPNSN